MNKKADKFKDLHQDNEMLSELLGVEAEEMTEEQEKVSDLIKLVNQFKELDQADNENAEQLLNDVRSIVASDTDDKLTPSLEEQTIAVGGNSRTNKKESKTKRTNLLIRPTAYSEFQKLAIIKHTSFNDLVNTVIENVVDANEEVLEAYDKLNELVK